MDPNGPKVTAQGRPRKPCSVAWYYFEKIPNNLKAAKCKLCATLVSHSQNTSPLFKHLKRAHPSSFDESMKLRKEEVDLYNQLMERAGKVQKQKEFKLPKFMTDPDEVLKPRQSLLAASLSPAKMPLSALSALGASSSMSIPGGSTSVSPMMPRPGVSSLPYRCVGGKRPHGEERERAPYGGKKRLATLNIMRFLARDMLPPSTVKGPGFKDLFSSFDHMFMIPSEEEMAGKFLPQVAKETKDILKPDVKAASSVSLSIESWKYQNTRDYLTLSAHYLRKDLSMASRVLGTFDYTDNKTETNMATSLKQITDDWGITENVTTLVTDHPNEILSAVSLVHGWEELTCYGYRLNQIILDSINEVTEVSHAHKKISDAGTYFALNLKASETLAKVQAEHNIPANKLMVARGNDCLSTFNMLDRIVEQYEAVNTVLCSMGQEALCIFDDEITLARSVLDMLQPFEAATRELCTENFTAISKMIPIAALLQQAVFVDSSSSEGVSGPQAAFRDALASKVERYLSRVETYSTLAAATLLDPRFKQHAFTDEAALECAKNKVLLETQAVIQNSQSSETKPGVSTLSVSKTSESFWNKFDKKVVDAGAMKSDTSEAENELRRYFTEVNIPRTSDPLQWWRLNEVQFPNLKIVARKYLNVPATAIPSSRLFSKEGDEFCCKRNLLKPEDLDNMIFLNQNL